MQAHIIGCTGLLCHVVGDWTMLKELLHSPNTNEKAGCCMFCTVTPAGIRDTSLTAPWRTDRLTWWAALERLRSQGRPISPLPFSAGCGTEGLHDGLASYS